jgi:hypothetical protein
VKLGGAEQDRRGDIKEADAKKVGKVRDDSKCKGSDGDSDGDGDGTDVGGAGADLHVDIGMSSGGTDSKDDISNNINSDEGQSTAIDHGKDHRTGVGFVLASSIAKGIVTTLATADLEVVSSDDSDTDDIISDNQTNHNHDGLRTSLRVESTKKLSPQPQPLLGGDEVVTSTKPPRSTGYMISSGIDNAVCFWNIPLLLRDQNWRRRRGLLLLAMRCRGLMLLMITKTYSRSLRIQHGPTDIINEATTITTMATVVSRNDNNKADDGSSEDRNDAVFNTDTDTSTVKTSSSNVEESDLIVPIDEEQEQGQKQELQADQHHHLLSWRDVGGDSESGDDRASSLHIVDEEEHNEDGDTTNDDDASTLAAGIIAVITNSAPASSAEAARTTSCSDQYRAQASDAVSMFEGAQQPFYHDGDDDIDSLLDAARKGDRHSHTGTGDAITAEKAELSSVVSIVVDGTSSHCIYGEQVASDNSAVGSSNYVPSDTIMHEKPLTITDTAGTNVAAATAATLLAMEHAAATAIAATPATAPADAIGIVIDSDSECAASIDQLNERFAAVGLLSGISASPASAPVSVASIDFHAPSSTSFSTSFSGVSRIRLTSAQSVRLFGRLSTQSDLLRHIAKYI